MEGEKSILVANYLSPFREMHDWPLEVADNDGDGEGHDEGPATDSQHPINTYRGPCYPESKFWEGLHYATGRDSAKLGNDSGAPKRFTNMGSI